MLFLNNKKSLKQESRLDVTGTLKEVSINKVGIKSITLPGTHLDPVEEYLRMEVKFPDEHLHVVNKVDKKKKKRTIMGR